jgi:hypothetical protein
LILLVCVNSQFYHVLPVDKNFLNPSLLSLLLF